MSHYQEQNFMASYLIVAQFSIKGHPRRTEHWSIVVLFNQNDGYVFELVGNYDTFTYEPKPHVHLQAR